MVVLSPLVKVSLIFYGPHAMIHYITTYTASFKTMKQNMKCISIIFFALIIWDTYLLNLYLIVLMHVQSSLEIKEDSHICSNFSGFVRLIET